MERRNDPTNFNEDLGGRGGGGAGDGLIFGEGFLHYEFGGLTFGGVYFRNFTVLFFKVMSLK